MVRGGGNQERLWALPFRLDEMSHHRDSIYRGQSDINTLQNPPLVSNCRSCKKNQKCFAPYIPMPNSHPHEGDHACDKRSSPYFSPVRLPDSSRSVLALQLTLTTLLTHIFFPTSQVPPLPHPAWPNKDVLPSTHPAEGWRWLRREMQCVLGLGNNLLA